LADFIFKLPDVGEGLAEAEIAAWHVAVGDTVEEDQPIADVMTDKATVELTSPVTGRVSARHGEVGETRAIGSPLVEFETTTEAATLAPASVPAQPCFHRAGASRGTQIGVAGGAQKSQ
jgi:2-oxoisovalerate dehydrogenase E2 component (dihydrolipoyl transacylase)